MSFARSGSVPRTGRPLLLSYEGSLSVGEVFARAQSEAAVLTWLLRGAGWLLAVGGLALLLSPAAVAPTWIPLIGGLAGQLVGCGVCLVAFTVGTAAAATTAAVAWFAVRPLLSAGVIAIAALASWAAARKARGPAVAKQD